MKRGLLLIVIICISIGVAYAQTNTASRLVAESGYIYMNSQGKHILNDSIEYTYAGKNGYDSTGRKNFTEYEWNFNNRNFRDFDTSNNIYYQDRVISSYDTFSNNLVVNTRFFLDSTISNAAWDTVDKYVDSIQNGFIKSRYHYYYLNGTINTGSKTECYWNGNGQIDSFYNYRWNTSNNTWVPYVGVIYLYQANLLDYKYDLQYKTSSFDTTIKYTYKYSAGQLSEDYYESKTSGVWYYGRKNVYSYNNNSLVDTLKVFTWNSTANAWEYKRLKIYTYDTNSSLVNMLSKSLSVNDESNDYFYNSNGLLTRIVRKKWNVTDNKYNDWYINNYYYEEYNLVDTPNSIYNVVHDNIVLDIYPVPANNYLHIDLRTEEDVDVNIYTSTGKLVKTQRLIGGRQKKNLNTISVAGLPTGSYVVNVFNRSFVESRQINIIK